MLLVFDWDGTLIDSTAKIVKSMQVAADSCGLAVLDDLAIKNIIGLGLPEAIQTLYPLIQLKQQNLLQAAYSDAYLQADQQPCSFFVGVEECLDVLQDAGHHIALATGKSRRGLDRVLHNVGWQKKFTATRCADETASKPNPLMLLELMEELKADKEDVWMIGDTEYDLEMAKNAAIKSVGVSYGAHDSARLHKHSPLAIIDDMRVLLELIER
jgi:phosphoglycolate phosphatase